MQHNGQYRIDVFAGALQCRVGLPEAGLRIVVQLWDLEDIVVTCDATPTAGVVNVQQGKSWGFHMAESDLLAALPAVMYVEVQTQLTPVYAIASSEVAFGKRAHAGGATATLLDYYVGEVPLHDAFGHEVLVLQLDVRLLFVGVAPPEVPVPCWRAPRVAADGVYTVGGGTAGDGGSAPADVSFVELPQFAAHERPGAARDLQEIAGSMLAAGRGVAQWRSNGNSNSPNPAGGGGMRGEHNNNNTTMLLHTPALSAIPAVQTAGRVPSPSPRHLHVLSGTANGNVPTSAAAGAMPPLPPRGDDGTMAFCRQVMELLSRSASDRSQTTTTTMTASTTTATAAGTHTSTDASAAETTAAASPPRRGGGNDRTGVPDDPNALATAPTSAAASPALVANRLNYAEDTLRTPEPAVGGGVLAVAPAPANRLAEYLRVSVVPALTAALRAGGLSTQEALVVRRLLKVCAGYAAAASAPPRARAAGVRQGARRRVKQQRADAPIAADATPAAGDAQSGSRECTTGTTSEGTLPPPPRVRAAASPLRMAGDTMLYGSTPAAGDFETIKHGAAVRAAAQQQRARVVKKKKKKKNEMSAAGSRAAGTPRAGSPARGSSPVVLHRRAQEAPGTVGDTWGVDQDAADDTMNMLEDLDAGSPHVHAAEAAMAPPPAPSRGARPPPLHNLSGVAGSYTVDNSLAMSAGYHSTNAGSPFVIASAFEASSFAAGGPHTALNAAPRGSLGGGGAVLATPEGMWTQRHLQDTPGEFGSLHQQQQHASSFTASTRGGHGSLNASVAGVGGSEPRAPQAQRYAAAAQQRGSMLDTSASGSLVGGVRSPVLAAGGSTRSTRGHRGSGSTTAASRMIVGATPVRRGVQQAHSVPHTTARPPPGAVGVMSPTASATAAAAAAFNDSMQSSNLASPLMSALELSLTRRGSSDGDPTIHDYNNILSDLPGTPMPIGGAIPDAVSATTPNMQALRARGVPVPAAAQPRGSGGDIAHVNAIGGGGSVAGELHRVLSDGGSYVVSPMSTREDVRAAPATPRDAPLGGQGIAAPAASPQAGLSLNIKRVRESLLQVFPTLRAAFAQWDRDGNRRLNKVEFRKGFHTLNIGRAGNVPDATIKAVVNDLLLNNDRQSQQARYGSSRRVVASVVHVFHPQPGVVTVVCADTQRRSFKYTLTKRGEVHIGAEVQPPLPPENWFGDRVADEIFDALDADGNGYVESREFGKLLTEQQVVTAYNRRMTHAEWATPSSPQARRGAVRLESIKLNIHELEMKLAAQSPSSADAQLTRALLLRQVGDALLENYGSLRGAFADLNAQRTTGGAHDDWISWTEFSRALTNHDLIQRSSAAALWEVLDADKSDGLELKEFKHGLEWIGHVVTVDPSTTKVRAAFSNAASSAHLWNPSRAKRCGTSGIVLECMAGAMRVHFLQDGDWAGPKQSWWPASVLTKAKTHAAPT